jgi:hypothetical protein
MKATLTSRDTNDCHDLMDDIITVGSPLEEHSSHDRDAPTLFWHAPCTLADGCEYLIPMVTTLEYDRGGYPLGLESWDGYDIDMFPEVQYLVIVEAFKEGDVVYERRRKDQRQLVEYAGKRKKEGKPLKTITFLKKSLDYSSGAGPMVELSIYVSKLRVSY